MYKKDYWMVLAHLEEIEKASSGEDSRFAYINNQVKEALKILRGYDGNNV